VSLRGFLRCGPAIVLLSLVKVVALSAVCGEVPFEEQVRGADVIFAGTLDRTEPVWPPGGGIIRKYRFSHVRYVKGARPESDLILTEESGRLGTSENHVIDLWVGKRYVILANKGRSGDLMPQICGWSPFGIWAESSSGSPVVHFENAAPILAVRDRYLLVLRSESWEVTHPPSAYQVFERPPKRSIDEELRSADSTYAADQARQDRPGGVRLFGLWPHQDPGTRVTEDQFVVWLTRVLAKNSRGPGDR
jgi:hypothetical protein